MTEHFGQPAQFRIGIAVDSSSQPRWIRRSLEKVLATGIARLELIIEAPPKSSRNSYLYRLYQRMDHALFRPAPDALERVAIADLIASAQRLTPDDLEGIKAAELDVVVNLGSAELKEKLAGVAKHGVWFYTFGTNENDEPGFRELMTEAPVTLCSLRSVDECRSSERVIYQSVSPTLSRFSVGLNNNQCYWKSAAFVARALVDLHQQRRDGTTPSHQDHALAGDSNSVAPTNLATAQTLLKLVGRATSRAVEKYSCFEQWVIAYGFQGGEFKYLTPPAETFWADPFPVEHDGRYYIFFEDYVNRDGKGHISVMEVDREGIVNGPMNALKMDCHLSYPFMFKWKDEHYMIPETGARNAVQLYRCDSFPSGWRLDQVLLEANKPLDATLIEVEGTWWMFVNIQEEGVTVNWEELHLYYAGNPRGPWKPHARNPVVSDVRSARPAGRLFWSNNALYRPGQDSSLRYGYATTINRIDRLTPTEYNETEVAKILPNWDKEIIGVHTFNTCNGITAIDCLVKRRRSAEQRGLAPPTLSHI